MPSARSISMRVLGLAAGLALAASTGAVSAQSSPSIEVRVGQSVTFELPRRPMIIDSEDRQIATLVVLPDGHAQVTGVAAGHTRIIGRDIASLPMIFPVTVLAAP